MIALRSLHWLLPFGRCIAPLQMLTPYRAVQLITNVSNDNKRLIEMILWARASADLKPIHKSGAEAEVISIGKKWMIHTEVTYCKYVSIFGCALEFE